jgi:hypothetical protein
MSLSAGHGVSRTCKIGYAPLGYKTQRVAHSLAEDPIGVGIPTIIIMKRMANTTCVLHNPNPVQYQPECLDQT